MNNKQVDDMPAHAIHAMKLTMAVCADLFPSFSQAEARRIFVEAYFNPPDLIKGASNGIASGL